MGLTQKNETCLRGLIHVGSSGPHVHLTLYYIGKRHPSRPTFNLVFKRSMRSWGSFLQTQGVDELNEEKDSSLDSALATEGEVPSVSDAVACCCCLLFSSGGPQLLAVSACSPLSGVMFVRSLLWIFCVVVMKIGKVRAAV
jgi:hypothetical protein